MTENIYYSKDHEWLRVEGEEAVVGITDFAAGELGDIVYVDIDTFGRTLEANAVFGSIEAVKTVSDLFLPAAGRIIGINPRLATEPELVNSDPFGEGWLIRLKINGTFELMDKAAYDKLIGHA